MARGCSYPLISTFTGRLVSMAGSGSSVPVFLRPDLNLILHCTVPHRRLRCAIISLFDKMLTSTSDCCHSAAGVSFHA